MWMTMYVSIVMIMDQVEVFMLHPLQPVEAQSQGIHHPLSLPRERPEEALQVVNQEAAVIRVVPVTMEEQDQQAGEILPSEEVLVEGAVVQTTVLPNFLKVAWILSQGRNT